MGTLEDTARLARVTAHLETTLPAHLADLEALVGNDHSPLEYIEVASIVPRTALLAELISAIGDGID